VNRLDDARRVLQSERVLASRLPSRQPRFHQEHGREPERQPRPTIWALLAVALLVSLFFGGAPERTMLWDAVFDAGHVSLFGLLSVAALRLVRGSFPGLAPGRTWWTALGGVAVLGAVTEALQAFQPNREPSFADYARDLAGAGAFLLVAAARPRLSGGPSWISSAKGRRAAVATAVVVLLVSGFQLGATVAVLAARRAAMPTLAALDGSWWERRIVRAADHSALTPNTRPARLPAAFSEPLARLDLELSVYPGVHLDEPYPDWRGYQRLAFTVVSDLDAPLTLVIRVHDAHHDLRHQDRFNRTLTIAPGVNRVAIPLDDIRTAPDRREMDLSRIRGIIIFADRPAAPTHVFLGRLRLESPADGTRSDRPPAR
jgi:hypothetical protein